MRGSRAENRPEGSLHVRGNLSHSHHFGSRQLALGLPLSQALPAARAASTPAAIPARQSLVPTAVLLGSWAHLGTTPRQVGSSGSLSFWSSSPSASTRKTETRTACQGKSREVVKSELSKQAIIYRPQNQC